MIWILVAHRADARLFESSGRHGDMHLIREFDFPEGRRQNREIDTDAKGSRFSTSGQIKHGLDPHLEAAEHIADIFAKELSLVLREGRTNNRFSEVMIIAEPGFLGKIRGFLDKETSRKVSSTFNSNLTGLSLHQLVGELDQLVHRTRGL